MATDLKFELSLVAKATERELSVGADQRSSLLAHVIEFLAAYDNGTSSNQVDAVHSGRVSVVSGVPATIDVRGGLASVLTGDAISFVEICWILLRNRSSTSGEYVTVGAGSNPVAGCWGAAGDAGVCGPGGLLVLGSPIDGFGTTAGTADIITITAATGTIVIDYLIVGRQS